MTDKASQTEKINAPQYTVAQARLAFISIDEVTDEMAALVFLDTAMSSDDDIDQLVDTLKKHRPDVYKKFERTISATTRSSTPEEQEKDREEKGEIPCP